MKRIIVIILIALFISSLPGCNIDYKKENDYDSMAENSILKIVNIDDFGERLKLPYTLQGSFSLSLTKNDVKNSIGIEHLRKCQDYEYSIHKVKFDDGSINYCFISYEGEAVIDTWFVSKIPNKELFLKIEKRKTNFDQIKGIDKAAIIFDANEPISYHRFNDGTIMEIVYNKIGDDFFVKEFGLSEDPVSIVKHLSMSDLKLIT